MVPLRLAHKPVPYEDTKRMCQSQWNQWARHILQDQFKLFSKWLHENSKYLYYCESVAICALLLVAIKISRGNDWVVYARLTHTPWYHPWPSIETPRTEQQGNCLCFVFVSHRSDRSIVKGLVWASSFVVQFPCLPSYSEICVHTKAQNLSKTAILRFGHAQIA